MRKWAERAAVVFVALLVLDWVGAKVHFYTRFWGYMEADNLKGYLAEHWPFWAAAAFIGLALILLGLIAGNGRSEQ